MKDASVSLCMIVRDEAAAIRLCLRSVKPLVSEIIVIDTGSKDETADLCRNEGAVVIPYKWRNDFAAARNYGLQYAKGDWILWMDADEVLKADHHDQIRKFLRQTDDDLVPVEMTHFYGKQPPDPSRCYHMLSHRLVRNHLGIQFQGMIHERLQFDKETVRIGKESIHNMRIEHFGYMDAAVAAKQKLSRNLKLLLTDWERTGDPWTAYHLASEYYRAHQLKQAYKQVDLCIHCFLKQQIQPPALAYKLKYELLLNTCPDEQTLAGLELALKLYPDYVDLHYYRGILLFSLHRFAEAIDSFLQCILMGETHSHYLVLRGAGSFYAYYYLGLCYESVSDVSKAQSAYRQALHLHSSFREAALRLSELT